jgi:EAL domain-containing protein (putative c-di-GMP-specific phosphodiesterase class I)
LQENKGVNLVLEITESESIEDYAMVKDFIDSVHFAGFQVAIDDFGSGYSNFAYLVEMQPDYLKIDGSIIKEILTDTNSRLVTESIVDIARKLNIAVVAEFVINEAIEAVLIQLGVDYAQGYFYGAPKALSEII